MHMPERFSMREYNTITLWEKKANIEQKIIEINSGKGELSVKKRTLETELAALKAELKHNSLEKEDFDFKCNRIGDIKKEQVEIEQEFHRIKQKVAPLQAELSRLVITQRKFPEEQVKDRLIELRDKYTSFAADSTRVASMRSMSAKFVEEIQALLKYIQQ